MVGFGRCFPAGTDLVPRSERNTIEHLPRRERGAGHVTVSVDIVKLSMVLIPWTY